MSSLGCLGGFPSRASMIMHCRCWCLVFWGRNTSHERPEEASRLHQQEAVDYQWDQPVCTSWGIWKFCCSTFWMFALILMNYPIIRESISQGDSKKSHLWSIRLRAILCTAFNLSPQNFTVLSKGNLFGMIERTSKFLLG